MSHVAVAESLLSLSRSFDSSQWVEPADGATHRSAAITALEQGQHSLGRPFHYPEVPLSNYLTALDDVRLMAGSLTGPLAHVVRAHLDGLERRTRALASVSDATYSSAAAQLDGLPPVALVDEAWRLLDRDVAMEEPRGVDSHAARDRVLLALDRAGLGAWTVEVTAAMSAKMSVNGPRRRLRIRSDTTFSARQLDRLIVHEVAGHVMRWTNSAAQSEPLAVIPMGRTMPTEEGLALLGEHQHGLIDDATLRVYAARVVAVDVAQRGGIMVVARAVAPYVGDAHAAEIAMRVKRGLRNPDSVGGSTKDWSYLGGLRMCQELANKSPDDVGLMLGVKWGLEYLPHARQLAEAGVLRAFAPVTLDQL